MSRIRHGQAVFLDTNMVVLKQKEFDKRVLNLKNDLYFVTDSVAKEIKDLETGGLSRIFQGNYKVHTFSSLREAYPDLCPVYYNLITKMYNPANVGSPDFYLQFLQAKKLQNKTLIKSEEKDYMKLMSRLKIGADSSSTRFGKSKTALLKHLDIGAFQYFRKKIKNRNSDNLLNDYKSIASIILFGLTKKTNTVLVTADRDLLAIVLVLAESMAQLLAFPYLWSLSSEEKARLVKGDTIEKFIDYDKFSECYDGVLGDIVNPYWQKEHISFTVRYWDDKEQKFVDDMVINFDEVGQEMIWYMHGPLSCPYAKNDSHSNWISYLYTPPDMAPPHKIKLILSTKKQINKRNVYVSNELHELMCRYAQDEKSGKLVEYYGFKI